MIMKTPVHLLSGAAMAACRLFGANAMASKEFKAVRADAAAAKETCLAAAKAPLGML